MRRLKSLLLSVIIGALAGLGAYYLGANDFWQGWTVAMVSMTIFDLLRKERITDIEK